MTIGELLYHGEPAFPLAWLDEAGRPHPPGLSGILVGVTWPADSQSLILVNRVDDRELRGILQVDDAPRLA